MSRRTSTRQRLVRAAEQLFRVQGYSGAGLKQLTTEAQAPWGSLYHFFPAGKAELGAEAIRFAGEFYAEGWRRAFAGAASPGEGVESVFTVEAKILEGSDYRNGCPVCSTTLDVCSLDEGLRKACDSAFELWLDQIVAAFEASGATPDDARPLALFVISSLEGAIVLARAAKSPQALIATGRFVRETVDRAAEAWY